jgi:hypothetical protein
MVLNLGNEGLKQEELEALGQKVRTEETNKQIKVGSISEST